MKLSLRSISVTVSLVAFFSITSFGQNITGIWRGYFITESGEQYKYELQIDQNKKNSISGVSYSYLDTRFYGKATLTGNFTRSSNTALVQEIKTVELKMAGGSVACIMKCDLTFSTSGKEQFLEGSFASMYEKSDATNLIKRGGDCGSGRVFLRKVPTSDFYIEPFLRNKTLTTTPEPKKDTVKKFPNITHNTKPVNKTVPRTPRPNQNTPNRNVTVVKRPKLDTIDNTPEQHQLVIDNKPAEKKIIAPPVVTRERKNELTRTIVVNHEEIEIRLYDNGYVDGDTVSIYLDGKIVLANKGLSEKPIIYKLKINDNEPEHTLVMVAENMGSIPPNTSLMIVQDGDKRYQVSIVSTEQKNAMVRFRYQKKE